MGVEIAIEFLELTDLGLEQSTIVNFTKSTFVKRGALYIVCRRELFLFWHICKKLRPSNLSTHARMQKQKQKTKKRRKERYPLATTGNEEICTQTATVTETIALPHQSHAMLQILAGNSSRCRNNQTIPAGSNA